MFDVLQSQTQNIILSCLLETTYPEVNRAIAEVHTDTLYDMTLPLH